MGAHGTGATVPPIDETVVGMKLVTPGKGTLDLTIEDTPGILKMARCGIGSLGVAAEVTLECVPAERLLEETFTATRAEIEKNHATWLKRFKHVRYMWIPHTDVVVVVGSNPIPAEAPTPEPTTAFPEAKKVEPMARLLKRLNPDVDVTGMGFGELRDELLKIDPLDLKHVKRVNAAEGRILEAKRRHALRLERPDPRVRLRRATARVRDRVSNRRQRGDERRERPGVHEGLTRDDRARGHPRAPRRSSSGGARGSSSPMSPVSNDGKDDAGPGLHSWIGIIMYLPTSVKETRDEITAAFKAYAKREEELLGEKYAIRTHWAKIESPGWYRGKTLEGAGRLVEVRRGRAQGEGESARGGEKRARSARGEGTRGEREETPRRRPRSSQGGPREALGAARTGGGGRRIAKSKERSSRRWCECGGRSRGGTRSTASTRCDKRWTREAFSRTR